jgi:hypothetical protein
MAGRVYRYVKMSADVMRGSKQKLTIQRAATVRPHQGAKANSCKLGGFRTHFVSEKLTLRRSNSVEEISVGREGGGSIPNRRLVTSVSTTEIAHGVINARYSSLAIHVNDVYTHAECCEISTEACTNKSLTINGGKAPFILSLGTRWW